MSGAYAHTIGAAAGLAMVDAADRHRGRGDGGGGRRREHREGDPLPTRPSTTRAVHGCAPDTAVAWMTCLPHRPRVGDGFVALVLALFVGIAAFLLWPARDAAPVRSPPLDGSSSRPIRGAGQLPRLGPGRLRRSELPAEDGAARRSRRSRGGRRRHLVAAQDAGRRRPGGGRADEPVRVPDRRVRGAGERLRPVRRERASGTGSSGRSAPGRAVLGEHSARLRRLGPGGKLTFRTGSVRVGAVVPDDAVGWSEVLLNRGVGRRLGITHERYLLAQPSRDL